MTDEMIKRIKNKALRKDFAKGASINETLELIETIEQNHIIVPLPDGRQIVALDKKDPDYPGIKIELIHKDGFQECIAWAEYNEVHDDYTADQRLRLMLWRADNDEPVINMAYNTGEFAEV